MKTSLAFVLIVAASFAASACSVAGDPPPPTPSALETFELCAQCHGPAAGGNRMANAPSIAGLPQWYLEGQLLKFKAGGRGLHFDDLTGMQMRPMALSLASEAEINSIAAHVASLPAVKPAATLTGADVAKGQGLYSQTCIACHGPDGAGNEAMKAPPLHHTNDWYLVSSLQKFKLGVRGTSALDTTGATMRPMALTLPDEQAIKDVVAYIATLKK
jgi:cytochrome c553